MAQYTYFIADDNSGKVKIGTTDKDPAIRLKQLQIGNGNPLRLALALPINATFLGHALSGSWGEREMHRRFSRDRICGEWFQFSDDIKQFIADMIAEGA